MFKKKLEEEKENPSLLDVFKAGDKVKQIYYNPNGDNKIYIGKIIQIKKHCMAIQWEKINGLENPEFNEKFIICHEYEIFNGDDNYSPIIKE